VVGLPSLTSHEPFPMSAKNTDHDEGAGGLGPAPEAMPGARRDPGRENSRRRSPDLRRGRWRRGVGADGELELDRGGAAEARQRPAFRAVAHVRSRRPHQRLGEARERTPARPFASPACAGLETHTMCSRRLLWLRFDTRSDHLQRSKGVVSLLPRIHQVVVSVADPDPIRPSSGDSLISILVLA
jgi:hypothetical protein